MPWSRNNKNRSSDRTIESSASSSQSSESSNSVEERTKNKTPNYKAIRKSLTKSRKFRDRDALQDHLGSNKSLQNLLRQAFADCDHFEHRLIDTLWRHQKTGKYEQHIKDMMSELEDWVDLASYKRQALTLLKKYDEPSGDRVRAIFKDGRLEEIAAQATPDSKQLIHELKNALRDGDKEGVAQLFDDLNNHRTISAVEDKILADIDAGIRSKHTIEDITGSGKDANWPEGTDFTIMLKAAFGKDRDGFGRDLEKGLERAIEKRDEKRIRGILDDLGDELVRSADHRKEQQRESRHERRHGERGRHPHADNHYHHYYKKSSSRRNHKPTYNEYKDGHHGRHYDTYETGRRDRRSEVRFALPYRPFF